jgi:hypothetical protein
MARILNRPMFRRGGSTNEGIMHGLVDRKGYADGPTQAEIYGKEYLDMLKKVPVPKSRFPMGQIGLNLISGQYAGDGLLQNIGGSAMGPYGEWTKADDATRNLEYQRDIAATKMGISRAEAEELARRKAAGESRYLKDESTTRKYFRLLEKYTTAPKDRYSKTIGNLFSHNLAEFGSRIQDNAYKSEEGAKFMQDLDGLVPYEIKGGQAQWQYNKMSAGAMYFHPEYKAFVQREPRTDDAPEQLVVYDPYTFTEVRRVNLE